MSRRPHDKQHASYGRLDGDISAQAKSKVKVKKNTTFGGKYARQGTITNKFRIKLDLEEV